MGEIIPDFYVQYGCGVSVGNGRLNFDASPTQRIEGIPIFGDFLPLFLVIESGFPEFVKHGDICKGPLVPEGAADGKQDQNSVSSMDRSHLAERYLRLMRVCLTRSFPGANYDEISRNSRTLAKSFRYAGYSAAQRLLRRFHLAIVQTNRSTGETMMGMGALENLHSVMHQVVSNCVPGDFVETGVWRGGGTIYMRAFLEVYGEPDRRVWVCDSFEGLPRPKREYEADRGSRLWESEYLAISLDQVRRNFAFYGLLDDRVCFLKGFFSDSIPTAPIERIAVLRLDGDMYESTIVVLEYLYPKVSEGGIVIIDDYGMLPECNRAVLDYRSNQGIAEPLQIIGFVNGNPLGAYWRKGTGAPPAGK